MSSIAEIEAAIEKLPAQQVNELARWIEAFRSKRTAGALLIEEWLSTARGTAIPGVSTDELMRLRR